MHYILHQLCIDLRQAFLPFNPGYGVTRAKTRHHFWQARDSGIDQWLYLPGTLAAMLCAAPSLRKLLEYRLKPGQSRLAARNVVDGDGQGGDPQVRCRGIKARRVPLASLLDLILAKTIERCKEG